MAFETPSRTPRNGWYRTWPDKENDGALWRDGECVGRVYRHHDGRWQWIVQVGNCMNGICGSKQRAKAEVEEQLRLAALQSRTRC